MNFLILESCMSHMRSLLGIGRTYMRIFAHLELQTQLTPCLLSTASDLRTRKLDPRNGPVGCEMRVEKSGRICTPGWGQSAVWCEANNTAKFPTASWATSEFSGCCVYALLLEVL